MKTQDSRVQQLWYTAALPDRKEGWE